MLADCQANRHALIAENVSYEEMKREMNRRAWGRVRRARKLSPLCNLRILYGILPWQCSTLFTVPHCVSSCKTRQINKCHKLCSQKLWNNCSLVCAGGRRGGGGGLINHICSYIIKEGYWWDCGAPTSLTDREHQCWARVERDDAPPQYSFWIRCICKIPFFQAQRFNLWLNGDLSSHWSHVSVFLFKLTVGKIAKSHLNTSGCLWTWQQM